jgi:3-deoxy-manno-octulosonate cytidylyltransferase (CMP-KDO synthetase)
VATPVYRLDWQRLDRLRAHKQTAPFSGTTCVRDAQGRALWFSKTILPARRGRCAPASRCRRCGSISGSMAIAWRRWNGLPRRRKARPNGWKGWNSCASSAGRTIATIAVDPPLHAMSGIDTPADLALAEAAIARLGDPYPL